MADPITEEDIATKSPSELWGLTPNAPPTTPAPQQQQQQQPKAPPLNISEAQRWGVEPLPGQNRVAPYAFDTGPPPVAADKPVTQQDVDNAREWDRSKLQEIEAYAKNELSVVDYSRIEDQQVTPQQHQDWGRLQTAKEMLGTLQNAKEFKSLEPMVRRLEQKINTDTKLANQKKQETRREQLKRDDAPYQSIPERDKTASAVEQHVGKAITDAVANAGSRDPPTARKADFDLSVSPIITMSSPLPGTDPSEKPNATNRDYRPIRDAATEIATHTRGLPTDRAVRYAIMMGTPGGDITASDRAQQQGFNGRYGMGAANYVVLGRDAVDNVIVQMSDGARLRVPGYTFRQLMLARQQGAQRQVKWEEDYKKSQEPGWVRRNVIDPALSLIPKQGF